MRFDVNRLLLMAITFSIVNCFLVELGNLKQDGFNNVPKEAVDGITFDNDAVVALFINNEQELEKESIEKRILVKRDGGGLNIPIVGDVLSLLNIGSWFGIQGLGL
ncbi:hypothetical protein K502DRAFT_329138 [Neoconidiobolus thromboides FSU 785]|nr:hypothetical protein K502DRAFT_329138 [Neoconidiobolus thromboides FSU 785]